MQNSKYGSTGLRINFLNFLLFALPVGVLMLILCWIWLQWCYNKQECVHKISVIMHSTKNKEKNILLILDCSSVERQTLCVQISFI